jgi:hypothetical protein
MNLRRSIAFCIVASMALVTIPVGAQTTGEDQTAHPVTTPSKADAASLQKKATEAQALIHADKNDRDQLIRAVKINEVSVAKEVLLKNGFTTEDLENAKITLRTGGGKGEDEIEISVSCDPKEITIQRSLPYFTK